MGLWGPKLQIEFKNGFPGPPGCRAQKVQKRSRKRVKIDYFSTNVTLFRLCFGLFGPWGRKAERAWEPIFELYLQLSARRAQMTPVAGKNFRKPRFCNLWGVHARKWNHLSFFRGFQREVLRGGGGNLNNWGRARTGCNS